MGVLEAFGVLRFKSLGGSNSQIYIYVNETKTMQMVRDKPNLYRNRLLEMINSRHNESVKMLSFMFQSNLTSEEAWEHLENYFLGILPSELSEPTENDCNNANDSEFVIQFQVGDELMPDYPDWESASVLFDFPVLIEFERNDIPLAEYYASKLFIGEVYADVELAWIEQRIAITSGDESEQFRSMAGESGWACFPFNTVTLADIQAFFQN
ncbi:MAG: hypothetical protein JXB29_01300 [Sedimentisphaerales bacterium]|nr:hypothetical protein [Sedimentisphaerales bacterium]